MIVCSQADMEVMSGEVSNRIVYIHQHHCNFERIRREGREVTTIGVIGTRGAFPYLPKELKRELAKIDMKLIEFSKFYTRQDIIDFYLSIDIQLVWRPYKKILSNPLKIVNAASFGIPTIALDRLRTTTSLYVNYARECVERSEYYHIEKVGEMYKELDDS